MKKVVVLCAALVLALSAFALVGCDAIGIGGGSGLEGRYVLTSLTIDGEDQLEILEELGMDFSNVYLEFTGDGNFSMVFDAMGVDETTTGTYELDGNNISMTSEGETLEGQLDGDVITISDEESTMTFEKR